MKQARWLSVALPGVVSVAAFAACHSSNATGSGTSQSAGSGAPTPQTLQLNVSSVDTTFTTRDHFIASFEMQVSGEPFAESMGRDLSGFSRDFVCQLSECQGSVYYDPALNRG